MELHETHTPWSRSHDGVLLYLTLCRHAESPKRPADGSNLDAHHDRNRSVDAHAVEFSKTAKPLGRCFLLKETHLAPHPKTQLGRTTEYSAYAARRRRKRRLPTFNTCPSARALCTLYSPAATDVSPRLTPPWSISRRASELDTPKAAAITPGRCTVPSSPANVASSISSGAS